MLLGIPPNSRVENKALELKSGETANRQCDNNFPTWKLSNAKSKTSYLTKRKTTKKYRRLMSLMETVEVILQQDCIYIAEMRNTVAKKTWFFLFRSNFLKVKERIKKKSRFLSESFSKLRCIIFSLNLSIINGCWRWRLRQNERCVSRKIVLVLLLIRSK